MAHGLHELGPEIAHPNLTPELTTPVFAREGIDDVTTAVAVVYRNEQGKPAHGGFFGFTGNEVVRLTLRDKGIGTDENPAWTAFGLLMASGPLLVKGSGHARKLEWSIVDFGAISPEDPRAKTDAQRAVLNAYRSQYPAHCGHAPILGARSQPQLGVRLGKCRLAPDFSAAALSRLSRVHSADPRSSKTEAKRLASVYPMPMLNSLCWSIIVKISSWVAITASRCALRKANTLSLSCRLSSANSPMTNGWQSNAS